MLKKFPLSVYFLIAGVLLGLAFSLNPGAHRASAQAEKNPAILYFFWGNGCPHCAEAEPFLKELVKKYPQMEVRAYEVWYNDENQALFQKMGAAFGYTPQAVPGIFLGEQHWEGYNGSVGSEIETAVTACIQTGCKDAGAGVVSGGVVDVWTFTSLSQSNLPIIAGGVLVVIFLGGLAYFIFRPQKRRTKSVRRHRQADGAGPSK